MTNARTQYDVIIIGAGAGGLNVASFMNRIGCSVLLVEQDAARIGGDCLNFGCVPSKALIHAARTVAAARSAAAFGVTADGEASWPLVRAHIEAAQATIREHENADWFREQGMDVVIGRAVFAGRDTVAVGGTVYRGRRIVIATGSVPRPLTTPGVEQVQLLTNESLFSLDALPTRLLVVGAGPIGIEMAAALRTLGVAVVVIDPNPQILTREDPVIAERLQGTLEQQGVEFRLGVTLEAFTSATTATIRNSTGETSTLTFDAVLASIGRMVDVSPLAVERAGIACDERGRLVLDATLRTTNRRITAVGDVAGSAQFTHAAELQAATVIRNFFSPWKRRWRPDTMASVMYTTPEVASFGRSAAALAAAGVSYRVLERDFVEDDRAITDGYTGYVRVFIDRHDRILGGTMLAPQAGELIQELILAQHAGLTVSTVFGRTYPYPTATRINRQLFGAYLGTKLTPRITRFMRLLFRLGW